MKKLFLFATLTTFTELTNSCAQFLSQRRKKRNGFSFLPRMQFFYSMCNQAVISFGMPRAEEESQ